MGAFTNYLEEKIIQHFINNEPQTGASAIWLALYTEIPTETSTGAGPNEAAYTGYIRKPITFTDYAAGSVSNEAAVEFPANGNASAAVTIKGAAIVTNATAGQGNMLMYGALATEKTLAVGDVLAFAVGALVLTVD